MLKKVVIIIVILLLASCRSQDTQLPTLFPSATPLAAPSLTFTPTPLVRSTLPPTWTLTPVPTDTPLPPTNTPPPTVLVPTLSPACNTFGPDFNRTPREFPVGAAPTVYWIKVEGAGSYHLSLVDDNANQLVDTIVVDTSFTFDKALFKLGTRYGWEVYPLDDKGIQMCYSRGGELLPVRG